MSPLPTSSIRWRLQFWQIALLAGVLFAFGVTSYQLSSRDRRQDTDAKLTRRVEALSTALRSSGERPGKFHEGPPDEFGFDRGPRFNRAGPPGPPPDESGGPDFRTVVLPDEVTALFAGQPGSNYYFVIWSRNGQRLKQSEQAPAELPRPGRPGQDTGLRYRMRGTLREAYHFTERGDGILVGIEQQGEQQALHRRAGSLALTGLIVLALGFGGAWWLIGRALRPIQSISESARRISGGRLSERIQVTNPGSELGQLATVLNETFARLEAAFERQQQFTADASHEFRTPLAVIITEAQTALRRERAVADYQETLQVCLHSAQEMRTLADSLLELARFDSADARLERQPVELAEIARLCVENIEPLAQQAGIRLQANLAPASIRGDADRIGQVITNLLANAIQYGRPAGQVRVATRRDGAHAVIEVGDDGEGIAERDIPHIFERFYRTDKARSRSSGHYGLGLAICKVIVAAHQGSIEAASPPGAGATFTVRLPAA